jgi:hypothetical protein
MTIFLEKEGMMTTVSNMDRWLPQAKAVGEPKGLSVPLPTLVGEGTDAAKLARLYWTPTDARPGLASAGAKLPATTPDDLLSLVAAVQEASTAYQLVVDPKVDGAALKARGSAVLGEITAVLEWHLDDGIETDDDARLAQLGAAHADDTGSADELAQALSDYATMAKPLAGALHGLGGFDKARITEALALAKSLGEVTQTPAVRSEAAKEAKLLRDRLAQLLADRVRLVRSGAKFVFRDHLEIARQFGSAYERRRRAAQKRASASAAPAAATEAK